jgi:ketosteroid isomerase-like protein
VKADHPNAKTARDTLSRMTASSSPDELLDLVADDVIWHEVDNPEPLHGKETLRSAMADVTGRVSFDFEPYDVLGDDDLVITYGQARLSAGERSTTYDAVEIHRMRDGRISERWAMVRDLDAMREFWASL